MTFFSSLKKQLSTFILLYLRFWARLQLRKSKAITIGITGTSGKTSALHSVAAILQDHISIKVSHKANSESGLPINILGLSINKYSFINWLLILIKAPFQFLFYWPKHQVYVAEMAIDSPHSPKNMSYLLSFLKPTIGIFLNAGSVHGENFDRLANSKDPQKRKEEITKLIATEKGKLIQSLPKKGLAILNLDDNHVADFQKFSKAPTLFFGKTKNSHVRYIESQHSVLGSEFLFEIEGKRFSAKWRKMVFPDHYGYTFAAAIAVSQYLNLAPKKAINSLQKNFSIPPGRSSLIKGINNSLILDSSYNSSLKPLIDSLKLLESIAPKRKMALLGDMRELGEQTKIDHQQIVPVIQQCCDLVILVGPNMKKFVLPILKRSGFDVHWFSSAYQAGEWLKGELQLNDILLVKGSQNELLLESAVEMLMANPRQANNLLCRRGEYWDKRRERLRQLYS